MPGNTSSTLKGERNIQTTANAALTFADIVRVLCQQLGHNHLIGLEPALKLERLQPACKKFGPYLVIIDNLGNSGRCGYPHPPSGSLS